MRLWNKNEGLKSVILEIQSWETYQILFSYSVGDGTLRLEHITQTQCH
jgi:hypothetical protein